jgi:hypothetical protein
MGVVVVAAVSAVVLWAFQLLRIFAPAFHLFIDL